MTAQKIMTKEITLADILAEESNAAMLFTDAELADMTSKIAAGIAKDTLSMDPYLKKYERAIQKARLSPKSESKNFPFSNASNVVMPYLIDATLDFNARATPPLLERKDICQITIFGKDKHELPFTREDVIAKQLPEEQAAQAMALLDQIESQPTPKVARGERIADMMNYDLCTGIEGWRESQDKALMVLPLAGNYFKKTYQCPSTNKRKSELVYPDKLIFDHDAERFEDAPRKSFEYELTRNEVVSSMRSGAFMELELPEEDTNELIDFVESHCELDLDDDGYKEPYIVNYRKSDSKIASIIPRYAEEDIEYNDNQEVIRIKGEDFFTQTIFIPDPSGSCMGMGYGILLADMFDVIDTNTNQLIDAGTLNNVAANSGFIRQGSRVGARAGSRQKKGTIELQMGKFTTLESDGNNPLGNDIAQMPFAGPSEPLRMLLESLKLEVREMVGVSQLEVLPHEAASMYLARLHQAMIKPNAIMVRVFNGLTKEFQRIYDVQKRYLSQEDYVDVLDDPQASKELDYEDDSVDIKTTADPSQGSEMERAARAEALYNEAKMMPQVYNLRHATEEWVKTMGGDVEKYVPEPQPNQPDPFEAIQAKAMQDTGEGEKMKGIAAIQREATAARKVAIDEAKAPAEIDKLESEIIKNLSGADKNETDSAQKELDSINKSIREDRKEVREIVKGVETNNQM